MKKKQRSILKPVLLLLIVLAILWFWKPLASAPNGFFAKTNSTKPKTNTKDFNKKLYSLDMPDSVWVVVNKHRQLPDNYRPADLVVPAVALRSNGGAEDMHVRQVTATAMVKMFTAASSAGAPLRLASGFRSQAYQVAVFNGFVRTIGLKAAERSSARPGYSEHQTGFASDLEPYNRVCEIAVCFANTTAGKWLAANAYKYGFIIRYPQSKTSVTGYEYEPWHVRYVGVILATEMHKQKIQTLEEFFGLPSAPSY